MLLRENKDLTVRLRNLEQPANSAISRQLLISAGQSSVQNYNDSTRASSMRSNVHSMDSAHSPINSSLGHAALANGLSRTSAFEEQLNRSRVYRHVAANHSASSLVDDGRSTLALSICSSLTMGEVSNISVFALPIFATELSNASAYDFTKPGERPEITTGRQRCHTIPIHEYQKMS